MRRSVVFQAQLMLLTFVCFGWRSVYTDANLINHANRDLVPCLGNAAIKECRCDDVTSTSKISCRNVAFTSIPDALPETLVKLDLTSNNISSIDERSFGRLYLLEDLILNDNILERIHDLAFANNTKLKQISFQNCGLIRIPALPMQNLKQLTSLQLDQNQIKSLSRSDFESTDQVRNLRLDGNKLETIPTSALEPLNFLESLNLGSNQITTVPVHSFPRLNALVELSLKRNHINRIDDDAFENITSLKKLELDENSLEEIPMAITKLKDLQKLYISGNKIKYIPSGVLQKTHELAVLELKGNPLIGVDPYAFSFLPKLQSLTLSEARELREFPSLNGTSALEILRIDRASLFSVPSNLCRTCPRLKTLDVKNNKLVRIPDLTECKDLILLDMGSNYITSIDGKLFNGLNTLLDLMLPHNLISRVPADAFQGLVKLKVLDLEGNNINFIQPDAFRQIPLLEDLNLGNNLFANLPVNGLGNLLHLKTFNNPNLREFPAPENFPRIQTLVLSYAYHCCAFMSLNDYHAVPPLKDTVIFPKEKEFDKGLWNSSLTDIWPQNQNLTKKFGSQVSDLFDSFGSDFVYPNNVPSYMDEYFEEHPEAKNAERFDNLPAGRIRCVPSPGPFLPCQDLFDWWSLRCGVWVVFLLAILGNGTVVFVLICSRSKCDVPRFLVCNLAAADFLMGAYLGILAGVDAYTLGEFRTHAIQWQRSGSCQFTGLLAVLSSEVSVYTLAVITLERNYAITHAMHLNKRLSLRHAVYIMVTGWSFALFFAVLPFFGVSDYRKYATCLPFETTTGPWSVAYVVFLNFFNGLAFLILMGCYLKMYCAIRGSQAWNSNDSRIAKRMALLVFTDFLCFSPIAFFSLTAIAGYQLVTLEQAKVFTVFVLPLNSCCNPFLYAILTKQFKKDCVLICKAIEESRVTRGIGRCRHSSNFSNRQTPANTNSLVDRSSRENYVHGQPCTCSTKLLGEKTAAQPKNWREWLSHKFRSLVLCESSQSESKHIMRSDQYAYQIAEIQQKQHKRASSMSSSENYSSSRSDSWRQNHHHCGIPMRLLDPKRRALSWVVTRKTSQDSNLSSSRNDSSGSGNTASTSLSRISRSSASSDNKQKPRLTRQSAVVDEADLLVSPAKLTVRFLTTIPSAAETSVHQEDENGTLYAILHPSPEPSPAHSSRSLSPATNSRSLSPASAAQKINKNK